MTTSIHKNLKIARTSRKDEFYTRMVDIEDEILHHDDYAPKLNGKRIYCNCDSPSRSNFYRFFKEHFNDFGLASLVATCYSKDGFAEKATFDGIRESISFLHGNGDFRSDECLEILENSGVVVTNPPFSLLNDFLHLMVSSKKDFITLASTNCLSYRDVFGWIKDGSLSIGYGFNKTLLFEVDTSYFCSLEASRTVDDGRRYGKVSMITWVTSLRLDKCNFPIELTKTYTPDIYPEYITYDAINVDRVKDIPSDYYGVMGVPITYLGVHCPSQFDIVGLGYGELAKSLGMGTIGSRFLELYKSQGNTGNYNENNVICAYVDSNGKAKIPYARVLIRRRQ